MTENVEVTTPLYPSEDPEKVNIALRNILLDPIIVTETDGNSIRLRCQQEGLVSLERLKLLISRERIQDAARRALRRGIFGNILYFSLNKQAAFAGRVSFTDASYEVPLGSLDFKVTSDDVQELVDWLAPRTKRKPMEAQQSEYKRKERHRLS